MSSVPSCPCLRPSMTVSCDIDYSQSKPYVTDIQKLTVVPLIGHCEKPWEVALLDFWLMNRDRRSWLDSPVVYKTGTDTYAVHRETVLILSWFWNRKVCVGFRRRLCWRSCKLIGSVSYVNLRLTNLTYFVTNTGQNGACWCWCIDIERGGNEHGWNEQALC